MTLDKSVRHNWETLKGCIVSAGETAVGRGRKKQPHWFLDAADTLQPLLDEHAVAVAKEEWICKVAGNAEEAKNDGCGRWMCVNQLQMVCRGCRPTVLLNKNATVHPDEAMAPPLQ